MLVEHRDPFAITNIREEWAEFYRKYFRLSVDFTNVQIPDDPGGFDRILFIPKGLTIKMVVEAYAKKGITLDIASNMDEQLEYRNIRATDHGYAVRFRDRQEADEELKHNSFNQLASDDINSITLLERLVFGLKYWVETEGQHLDVLNVTLCAGSHDALSHVPCVYCSTDDRKVVVRWYYPVHAFGNLRSRQAVSN